MSYLMRSSSKFGICTAAFAALVLTAGMAAAQEPTLDIDPVECLPNQKNGLAAATVADVPAGGEVRLYFRRLNPIGSFYWVEMHPAADADRYWSAFPRPEDRRQEPLTDEWWQILADRDWVDGRDRAWFEDYFEDQQHELAEFYVSVHDASGIEVRKAATRLAEVWDAEDCETRLTLRESGWSQNLTIGETTQAQIDKPVFHWLCDGVVTRISSRGLWRADQYCRGCVVAGRLFPIASGAAGAVSASIIEHPAEASPTTP